MGVGGIIVGVGVGGIIVGVGVGGIIVGVGVGGIIVGVGVGGMGVVVFVGVGSGDWANDTSCCVVNSATLTANSAIKTRLKLFLGGILLPLYRPQVGELKSVLDSPFRGNRMCLPGLWQQSDRSGF